MRMKVTLKFDDKQRQYVNDFATQVGMSVDEFCKRAVFYAINHAYQKAEQLEGKQANGTHDSSVGNDSANTGAPLAGESTNSAALPDTSDSNPNT